MKHKVKSAVSKRVKVTGSGKLRMQKACKNHLLSSKSVRQKKAGRLGQGLSKGMGKVMKKLLKR